MSASIYGRLNSTGSVRVCEPEALEISRRKLRSAKRILKNHLRLEPMEIGSKEPQGPRVPPNLDLPKSDNRFTGQNFFIDSYYPVFGNCSEDNSDSSKKIQKVDCPVKNFTRKDSITVKQRQVPTKEKVLMERRQSDFEMRREGGDSRDGRVALQLRKSTSDFTLDSKTYTVFSYNSEPDSVRSGRRNPEKKIRLPLTVTPQPWVRNRFVQIDDSKIPENENDKEFNDELSTCETSSAAECFIHLHRRIETLEDLLQQTLEGQKQLNDKKAVTIVEKPQEPDHSDTEQELRKIRKRLKNLERKMKEEKKEGICQRILNEEQSSNNALVFTDDNEEKDGGGWQLRLHLRPKVVALYPRTKTFEISDAEDKQGEKKEPEAFRKKHGACNVKKNFMSECKKLKEKCSSIIGKSEKGDKTLDRKFQGKTKKTEKFRCYPAASCSDVDNLKSPIPTSRFHDMNLLKSMSNTNARKKKRKCRLMSRKKNSKTKILQFQNKKSDSFGLGNGERKESSADFSICDDWECKNEGNPRKDQEIIKRSPQEIIDLDCKKAKIYSVNVERSSTGWRQHRKSAEEDPWKARPDYDPECWQTSSQCQTPLSGETSSPFQKHDQVWNTFNAECDFGAGERFVRKRACKSPLEILKGGGKIKIPVLFEELCREPPTDEAVRKTSNISMRFVLLDEGNRNPLNSLRRLIKKLSHTHSTKKTEQYVFGVSKCCCDNQVIKLGSDLDKKFRKKFG